jgi:histone-lysine N-methyltransferase SETMAR
MVKGICSEKTPNSGLTNGFSTKKIPPAHDALRVCEFLAKKSVTEMYHPTYPPDLGPCDFWLFSKLRNTLTGHRFTDIADIQPNVTTLVLGIPNERCSRLSPAAESSSHEMHSFTRTVFPRRQQPLLHK